MKGWTNREYFTKEVEAVNSDINRIYNALNHAFLIVKPTGHHLTKEEILDGLFSKEKIWREIRRRKMIVSTQGLVNHWQWNGEKPTRDHASDIFHSLDLNEQKYFTSKNEVVEQKFIWLLKQIKSQKPSGYELNSIIRENLIPYSTIIPLVLRSMKFITAKHYITKRNHSSYVYSYIGHGFLHKDGLVLLKSVRNHAKNVQQKNIKQYDNDNPEWLKGWPPINEQEEKSRIDSQVELVNNNKGKIMNDNTEYIKHNKRLFKRAIESCVEEFVKRQMKESKGELTKGDIINMTESQVEIGQIVESVFQQKEFEEKADKYLSNKKAFSLFGYSIYKS